MSSDQNRVPNDEKLFQKLNPSPGDDGGNFMEYIPNSSELIISESSDEVNNLSNLNETDVLINANQRDTSMVSGDATQVVGTELENTLPPTTILLTTDWGSNVYVVGTAHFSEESQEDVARVIRAVQPNCVVVELCKSRSYMLAWSEEVILKMAEKMDFKIVKQTIKTYGVLQSVIQLLLLSVSSQITREMGMAPGGEFRRAFKESLNIQGCTVFLGDRPIEITLRRAFASMTWWQSIKFACCVIFSKKKFDGEQIEKCKNRDYLEKMLEMFGGEFPGLKEVFVNERDLYLTHSLFNASLMSAGPEGPMPNTVVGVVGMGHVAGIQRIWEKGSIDEDEIRRVFEIPPETRTSKVIKFTVKASFIGLAAYGLHKLASRFRFYPPMLR